MIDYIKGEVAELQPASVTLEAYGVGYHLHISLNTYTAIGANRQMKLYVVEAIREDAHLLYGFADKHERELFLALVSVSGVGAGTARMILSSLGTNELEAAIASGNVNLLKGVKGIGMKTAQRIIVDLKDKIKVEGGATSIGETAVANINADEAVSALVMLGFTQAASQKAVATITKQMPNATIEQVIKAALKIL